MIMTPFETTAVDHYSFQINSLFFLAHWYYDDDTVRAAGATNIYLYDDTLYLYMHVLSIVLWIDFFNKALFQKSLKKHRFY